MAEIGSGEQSPPTRQELRQFSKEKHDELAQHVWAPRHNFPRLSTTDRIKSARKDMQQYTTRVKSDKFLLEKEGEKLAERTQEAQMWKDRQEIVNQLLSDQRTQLTKRILAFFRPQMQAEKVEDLQTELDYTSKWHGGKEQSRRFSESEYERRLSELRQAEESEDRARKRPQEILDEFYEDTLKRYQLDQILKQERQELEEYKEEYGGVERVIQKHDVYFVHATNPLIRSGWGNNPFLREGIDWSEKVACVLAKQPTLSASSIRPGSEAHTWANIGVVLNGGRIDDASAIDAGTVAQKNGERIRGWVAENIDQYKSRVLDALTHRGAEKGDGYNEYIIADPNAIGLFINLDSIRKRERSSDREVNPVIVYQTTHFSIGGGETMAYKEVFDEAEKFEMPVFVFDKGIAYESTLDPVTKSIVKGIEVTPREILERDYTIPKDSTITEKAGQALRPEMLV